MTDRYERIRAALAMGPTPGEWYWSDAYRTPDGRKTWSLIGDGGFGILSCDGEENSPQSVDAAAAELIAACDPDTIRALLAERDALAAALEAAREDGWQPIETAPKDGTRVLLWYEWHDLPVVGDFRHDRWWSVHSLGGNLVYNKDEVLMPIATARPAHWRPLPAPPAIESALEERDALAHGGEE